VSTSGQDGITAEDSCVYLGSHNMSQAAWGSFEKNKTQICIYNCELGVVFGPGQSQAVKELVVNTLPIKSSKPAKYNLAVDRPFIMEKQQIYRNNFEK
jgi:tyrosyl-DNA phosphodiesterase-1